MNGWALAIGVVVIVSATTTAAACKSPSLGPSPSVHAGTGTWVGRMVDRSFGEGTLRLVLPAPGADQVFRGTWSATFPNGRSGEGQAISPAIVSDRLPMSLLCASGGQASLLATLDGSRMTGGFFTLDCTEMVRGTVDLTKQ